MSAWPRVNTAALCVDAVPCRRGLVLVLLPCVGEPPCRRGRDEAGETVDAGGCRDGGDGDDDAAGVESESVAHRQM